MLPQPPPPPSPAASEIGVEGVAPYLTPNSSFYRIDTALVVPQLSPSAWRLRIHGMVDRELTPTFDDLLARPMVERVVTLACVSNEVGGRLIGNARWLGVPLADVLAEAGVQDGADQLVSRSYDGWTCGTPTAIVLDGRDALLAVGMNGEPLPVSHGFPVRMVVPGLYGYVSATKWVTELEPWTFDAFDAYRVRRGWAVEGPIKTMSRIDTPPPTPALPRPGTGDRGGGLGPAPRASPRSRSRSTRPRQRPVWPLSPRSTPGGSGPSISRPRLAPTGCGVRATDADGYLQTEEEADVVPDGATGWHTIFVDVAGA